MVFASIMRYFVKVSMTMFCLLNLNGNAQFHRPEPIDGIVDDDNVDEPEQNQFEYGYYDNMHIEWVHQLYEEEIDIDVTRSLVINSVDYSVASEIQNLTVITTNRFGKAIVLNSHLQTAEHDEHIFHESLVHPALLIHNAPKTILIMGGGSGSAAREVLKHKDITKVIICEIDRQVVNLSHEHMEANNGAFNDERLHIIYNDAKDELERSQEKFDVIIGDLCEPNTSISNNLYTRSFYEDVVKPRLKENGLFVTYAGRAGNLSHKVVFSQVHNTLKQVFPYVVAYTAHVSSYGDLFSNIPINVDAEQLNNKIGERINGELSYLDGDVIAASTVLNKTLKKSLMEETSILN
ncbi:Spermidine/spermine synthase [Sesbania bispinosa]|nr:Spermidine/spermine synthase [Sesbania bispinosa]